MKTELRIVKLIEPSLCLSCRFAAAATIELANGSTRRSLYCRRLLCDNHAALDGSSLEEVSGFAPDKP